MNKLLRYCTWELKNELIASGCFCVMLFCYGIVELIYGHQDIKISVVFEMFILNYVISTIQKLILDEDKEYDKKTYNLRATGLTIFSFLLLVLSCKIFGWFSNRSIYAEIFLYVCMISAYFFIWFIAWISKKYDTKQLNEQLLQYKENNQDND